MQLGLVYERVIRAIVAESSVSNQTHSAADHIWDSCGQCLERAMGRVENGKRVSWM